MLQDTSILGPAALRVLCKQQQEKRKQTWQDKIVKFLADKDIGKENIESVNLAISQLLADMFNNGNTYSKYLALTWDEYENDEDLKKAREKAIKKKNRNKKHTTALPNAEPSDSKEIVPSMDELEGISSNNGLEDTVSSNMKGKQKAEVQTLAGVNDPELDLLHEQIASGEEKTLNSEPQQVSIDKTNKEEKEVKDDPDNKDLPKDYGTIRQHDSSLLNTVAIESDDPSKATRDPSLDHPHLPSSSHNNSNLSETQSLDVSSTEHISQALTTPASDQVLHPVAATAIEMPRHGPRRPRREVAAERRALLQQQQQQADQAAQTELGEPSQVTHSSSTPFPELQTVSNTPPSSASDAAKSKRRDSIETIRRSLERRLSTSDGPASTQAPTSSAGNINAPKSNANPSISSLALLPGPLRDVIGNEVSHDSTAPKPRSVSSGSPLRYPVAIPDPKYLFGPKKSGNEGKQREGTKTTKPAAISNASGNTQGHIMSKDDGAQSSSKSVHHGSVLRAEAPEFVPAALTLQQSRLSSSVASPEVAPVSSLPMSISTSATSQASVGGNTHKLPGLGQAIVARKGLNVTFDLPDQPYTIKNAPMIYPSEASIRDLKERLLNRPRSNSTGEVSSKTVSNFNMEFAHQVVKAKHVLETWPDFADDHLQFHTSWRYADHNETPESIILSHGDVPNFFRPSAYYTTIRDTASRDNLIPTEISAVLMKTRSGCGIATGQFDPENNVWKIFAPSSKVGADIREMTDHPDHLKPEKLREVQGLEIFFYNVHVAIRLVHTCQRKECTNQLRDDSTGIVVCRGCGPLSPVRYCSTKCLFEDLPNHWKECGTPKFYPPYNLCVDPDISFPASFSELFPMIKDISGWDSMERHRIHWLSMYLDGEYGLYPDETRKVLHVKLSTGANMELRRRVQRLINCALLDRRNRTLISYLYILIRDALCKQINADVGEFPVVLRYQFIREWNFEWKGPEGYELLDNVEPCECMWVGKSNFSSCKDSCKGEQVLGEKFRGTGLKPFVESLEKKHWILRVWQTNHTIIRDWRERLYGKGFRGVNTKKLKDLLPVLGVGYDGHISKGMVVGEWRPRLTLEAPPPPFRRAPDGTLEQDPTSFLWKEPEA